MWWCGGGDERSLDTELMHSRCAGSGSDCSGGGAEGDGSGFDGVRGAAAAMAEMSFDTVNNLNEHSTLRSCDALK